MNPCYIIGVHDDGALASQVPLADIFFKSNLVIGATHQLHAVAPHLPASAEQRDSSGRLGAVVGWVAQAQAEGLRVVVLATGDPLCFGIAATLIRQLGKDRVVVLPTLSSLQLAAARLGLAWQDARLISVHAADAGEWVPASETRSRHDHGLAPLLRAISQHDKLLCLTSPSNDPARIARLLIAAGLGDSFRIDVVARLTSPDETVCADLTPADVATRDFPQPNVVALRRVVPRKPQPRFGFDDADYVQRQPEKGLLTKFEVRAVSLAKLRLKPDALLWDIGAGAGTVGLEAAQLCPDGHTYAIEKNPADAVNARENARRFGVFNYTLAEGKAPEHLDAWPDPDAVFIGGSSGELAALIALCLRRLKPGGRLVMNFVTFENLATATAALKAAGVTWEVVQLSAARSQPILDMHRLAAQNPVWIVVATKEIS